MAIHFSFNNSYARLPDRFFARVEPTTVSSPRLIAANGALAADLGLDAEALASPEGVAILAGKSLPHQAEPLAMAYAGHQFGNFVPQLGDGRAILLGEVVDKSGKRRDVQLKGAGPTPFSRNGDGRAALGPVLREYILSESMAALGIPTTRALAAVTTGDKVYRGTADPGAVFARVASSHVRVGTFQYFAARGDTEGVRLLADHVIARLYPEAAGAENPYRAMLEAVIKAQASLIARWMLVGFIHGVMNTDNMAISGETIDYGPCAFMDTYSATAVFSSIDRGSRYAYGNQPRIAQWNLARLAETLLPLLAETEAEAIAVAEQVLDGFNLVFSPELLAGLRRKIGLLTEQESDAGLIQELLDLMAANEADFTLTFRRLGDAVDMEPGASGLAVGFNDWLARWRARLAEEPDSDTERRTSMREANPLFVPRNHRVEAVIRAAVDNDDFRPFHELLAILQKPFDEQPSFASYAEPPAPEERVLQTFCGT